MVRAGAVLPIYAHYCMMIMLLMAQPVPQRPFKVNTVHVPVRSINAALITQSGLVFTLSAVCPKSCFPALPCVPCPSLCFLPCLVFPDLPFVPSASCYAEHLHCL